MLNPWLITKGVAIHQGYALFLGLFLMTVGFVIYARCVWDFIAFGKGTPAPVDAPKHLVVRGLYHYTRNPMYVGILLFISGWILLYQLSALILYGLGVAACFQLLVLFYEEPMLKTLFASDYEKYSTSVNRWLPQFPVRDH